MTSTTAVDPGFLREIATRLSLTLRHPVAILDDRVSARPGDLDRPGTGRLVVMPPAPRIALTGPWGLAVGAVVSTDGKVCAVVRRRTPDHRRTVRSRPVLGPRAPQPGGTAA